MAHAKTPPDWGDDLLAKFLDTARDNVLASFVQARPHYDRMLAVDAAYFQACDNLLNPQDQHAPFLLLQAHASYRAPTTARSASGTRATAASCVGCAATTAASAPVPTPRMR